MNIKAHPIPLPIDSLLSEITQAVKTHSQVILTASPGAGKTTRLPAYLLDSVQKKIAVLEPRRMAAVAACQRLAEENDFTVGEEVGYQVRFDSKVSAKTRLIFMTDAYLFRRLVDDPELKDFDLIVIDEFHERNLNQDILLGVLTELQEMGRDIKILLMSATLDLSQLKEFLPLSRHIDVPGKVFPLAIRYAKQPLKIDLNFDFYQRVADAIVSASNETAGDILVFLPGVGEIARTEEVLLQKNIRRDVFSLHGSLTLEQQRKILTRHSNPRVILSTNVAEASVTVPGVDFVIDTGLAKVMKMNLNSGFSRLELMRSASFNAKQRAGRAAREKEGTCLRLWTQHDEIGQAETTPAESERIDLTSTLLLLAHLGVTNFSRFTWLEAPPQPLVNLAENYLISIEALGPEKQITSLGQDLLRLPLHPRWGMFLTLAKKKGGVRWAARAAAILEDRNILKKGIEVHSGFECDITFRLSLLEDFEKRKVSHDLQFRATEAVLESAKQIERLLSAPIQENEDDDQVRKLLLKSQSDRLCRRRQNSERGVMVGGRGVRLSPESQVRKSEFFLSLQGVDQPGQPETLISMASGFSKAEVLEVLSDKIQVSEDVYFDEDKGQFYLRRARKYLDLEIDEPTLTKISANEIGDRFTEVLLSKWEWIVSQNENLKNWMARWNFLVNSDSALADELTQEKMRRALEMAAFEKTRIDDVLKQDLVGFLESQLSKVVVQKMKAEVPAQFLAPSGVSHKIHYESGINPYVEIRLQEVFGLTSTPQLGFGKVPLTFRLLAPNFRPIQTTSDIAGFWQRVYIEVKKELKARYPKHSWPEDPLKAIPVAKGRRRPT